MIPFALIVQVSFDVVALNKATYETKRAVLSLFILRKRGSGSNSIHMKIDNLNWVHLMDPGRVENLKNIFKFVWLFFSI